MTQNNRGAGFRRHFTRPVLIRWESRRQFREAGCGRVASYSRSERKWAINRLNGKSLGDEIRNLFVCAALTQSSAFHWPGSLVTGQGGGHRGPGLGWPADPGRFRRRDVPVLSVGLPEGARGPVFPQHSAIDLEITVDGRVRGRLVLRDRVERVACPEEAGAVCRSLGSPATAPLTVGFVGGGRAAKPAAAMLPRPASGTAG